MSFRRTNITQLAPSGAEATPTVPPLRIPFGKASPSSVVVLSYAVTGSPVLVGVRGDSQRRCQTGITSDSVRPVQPPVSGTTFVSLRCAPLIDQR